jgi:hypothetical protein
MTVYTPYIHLLQDWFPDKEDFIYFEQLAKEQDRIYPDAMDYGVRVDANGGNPAIKSEARSALARLMKTYGAKVDKFTNQSTTKVFIPTEEDLGLLAGYVLTVSHFDDKIYRVEFLTINIEHTQIKESEAKAKYGYK